MLRQATRMATAAGATVAAAASAMAANTSSDAEISSDELGFDGQPARVFKPIDFSKYKMDHHLLHHSLAGEGKLEKYEVHLSVDRQHLRAYARLGEKGAYATRFRGVHAISGRKLVYPNCPLYDRCSLWPPASNSRRSNRIVAG